MSRTWRCRECGTSALPGERYWIVDYRELPTGAKAYYAALKTAYGSFLAETGNTDSYGKAVEDGIKAFSRLALLGERS